MADTTQPTQVDVSQIAAKLEGDFASVFGDGGEQPSTSARNDDAQRASEEAESLASLEGATTDDTGGDPSLLEGNQTDAGGEDGDKVKQADDARRSEDVGKDASTDGPTLSDRLVHAAKRNGWSDDEIRELYEANPDVAEKTFERLHQNYSDLSARYAGFGHMAQTRGQQVPPPPPPQSQTQRHEAPHDDDESLIQRIYGESATSLRERLGDDFDALTKPLLRQMHQMLEPVRQQGLEQQQNMVAAEAGQFFKSMPNELHSYYGNGTGKVSEQQSTARHELAQLADQIRAGAAVQGVEMSVTEALDRALALHSQPYWQAIERKRLTTAVKSRSRQMTSRPSHRKMTPQSGSLSEEAAMDAYASAAASMGLDLTGGDL